MNQTQAHVAAARNPNYQRMSMRRAFRDLLDRMQPPLPSLISAGNQVLVKPFLRHGSIKLPASRLISHPEMVALVIEAVKDCGGIVTLGDEGAKKLHNATHPPEEQWIYDLAKSSGARLVSFARAGAKPVSSGLLYPRTHLITRAVLDADVVVNCANFQPHGSLLLSGAVKNMFNALVGHCQQHLHQLFPHPLDLARAIVDVCLVVRPTVSFLDLTSIRDPGGSGNLLPVALLLASTDPVALDAVAARATGYGQTDVPTLRLGEKMGLGCANTQAIAVAGLDWSALQSVHGGTMVGDTTPLPGLYSRVTRLINHLVMRPSPAIRAQACTGCGDCNTLCPVQAIEVHAGVFRINSRQCVQCNLCISTCEAGAIEQQFGGMSKALRALMMRPTHINQP